MKTFGIVLGSLALAVALVAGGLWAGSALAQGRWDSGVAGYGPMGRGMMGYGWGDGSTGLNQGAPYSQGGQGYGMMGGNWSWGNMPFGSTQGMPFGSTQGMPCGGTYATPGQGEIRSLEEVETAVHDYVERLGYTGLEVTEVMEFERNYYAIVAEEDTGIGAMEVLVDKTSGAVGPEPGPNMMWNAKYGMHGRGGGMMGTMGGYASGKVTLSPEEAQDVAQRWLDGNLPGRAAGEADAFYGYYTLHFLRDGEIEGMLSVHGSSGDVWYHGWHGDFLAMTEGHD